jgi:NAD(P)-dependent dehydrogenase (short-subunit alcohol dehydrogenase family)
VKYLAQASGHGVAHIAILDINASTGEEVLASLKDRFPNVTFSFYLCDVMSWEVQAEVFESVYTNKGRIDIVFVNAGIAETGFLFQTEGDKPVKPDLKTYDIDLTGAMYSMNRFLSPLVQAVMADRTSNLRSRLTCSILY